MRLVCLYMFVFCSPNFNPDPTSSFRVCNLKMCLIFFMFFCLCNYVYVFYAYKLRPQRWLVMLLYVIVMFFFMFICIYFNAPPGPL